MTKKKLIPNYAIALIMLCGCSKNSVEPSVPSTATTPAITTTDVINIHKTTATGGGNVTSDGGTKVTTRGVCWSKTGLPMVSDQNTSDGDGVGAYTSNMTGLTAETKFYIRAYAANAMGVSYGTVKAFNTSENPLIDIEGNSYLTTNIGTQVWMAENLKTTKYNDGTSIKLVTDPTTWSTTISEAYCWYLNDKDSYEVVYGALYNWYVVETNKVCPTGWHVPTEAEWETLYASVQSNGGELKESGTSHWQSPNAGADNSSSFSGLPGGYRFGDGEFRDLSYYSGWWTSDGFSRNLNFDKPSLDVYNPDKRIAFSIRCVRDN